jgi:hypothetical protein
MNKKFENWLVFFGIFFLWGSLYYIIEIDLYDKVYGVIEKQYPYDLWYIAGLIVFDIWLFIVFLFIFTGILIDNIFFKKEKFKDFIKDYLIGFLYIFKFILFINGFVVFMALTFFVFWAFVYGFFSGLFSGNNSF